MAKSKAIRKPGDAFKEPMLAPNEVVPLDQIPLPMMGSFKMDGMRISVVGGKPLTRTLKDIPNNYVRTVMTEAGLHEGSDGELGVMANDGVSMDFRRSMSALSSEDGEPEFRYFIFDNWNYDGAFIARWESLHKKEWPSWVIIAEQRVLNTLEEVQAMYAEALALKHEGLILRTAEGEYKMGRATVGEAVIFKVKPKRTAEAEIVGTVQGMKNTNARERDARGHAKRSGAKVGKVPVEKIGALICRWLPSAGMTFKETFEVGGGWDAPTAAAWFKFSPVGQIATLEFADTGDYDKPRHAQFKGIRDLCDL